MKKISVKALKEILDLHKLWLETDNKQGKCAFLANVNLANVNLANVNLSFVNLEDTNLTGANLTGANLEDTNLTGANLEDTNLKGAKLTGADLYCAEFRGANLRDANLSGANLEGANLKGANLRDANLSGANLYCAYLNNAIGLPDISWIEPGILVQLNHVYNNFYVGKEWKQDNFIQDSIGMFIQNNPEDETIDMLVGDRIIRNIPDWVKYSGMKKVV